MTISYPLTWPAAFNNPIAPDDLLIEVYDQPDGTLRVKISATCARIEHAAYLRKAVGMIEDLCSIAPPPLPSVDGDWAE